MTKDEYFFSFLYKCTFTRFMQVISFKQINKPGSVKIYKAFLLIILVIYKAFLLIILVIYKYLLDCQYRGFLSFLNGSICKEENIIKKGVSVNF